jgi:hypothetical protein
MFFLPFVANAQERLGDGAMGALAGALVGGPVGRSGWVGRGRGGRLFGRASNCVQLGRQRAPALSPRPLSPISGAIIRLYEASHKPRRRSAIARLLLVRSRPSQRARRAPPHRRQWHRESWRKAQLAGLERVPIKWNHLIDKDATQKQRVGACPHETSDTYPMSK